MATSRRRKTRLGRNGQCWCGSGKKYKNCHLIRIGVPPLEFGQLHSELRRPFIENKTCLHPDAPVGCGKVIRAHTLQRSGIIRRLIGADNHVRTFHPIDLRDGENSKINSVGWREASTFFGFCESHDCTLFSAIEREPFVGTPRQVLLVGYRALCHELYQKLAAADAEQVLTSNLDRGLAEPDQRLIQKLLAVQSAGRRDGLQQLLGVKEAYDRILRTGDYSSLHGAVLSFTGNPYVASTGSVHVDFDFRDKRLQNIARDPAPIHGLNFGTLSTPDGCVFVAVWPAEFRKCGDFIDSLLGFDRESVPSLLVEFFFAYVENTYFSESWWSALPERNQRRLRQLATTAIQYGSPLRYSGLRHVDWKLAQTNVSLGAWTPAASIP